MKDKNKESTAEEILQKALEVANLHIMDIHGKLIDGVAVDYKDGLAISNYLKSLTTVDRAQREKKKDLAKNLTKYTDEELEAELKKYAEELAAIPKKAKKSKNNEIDSSAEEIENADDSDSN
jgi:hypothetical protein